jgi:branched-subunit amino acid aminotransferase/4-amino-4-deoxychorismate lyase
MRADILDRGVVTERLLTVEELATCTGLWHVNSVRGMTPVTLSGYPNLAARPAPAGLQVLLNTYVIGT